MKKLSILIVACAFGMSMMAENMPASDSRVTYVGRTQVVGDNVSFDWTATYLRIAFTGKKLSVRLSDTVGRNFFNVYVDQPQMGPEPTLVIGAHGQDSTIVLFEGKKGNHVVVLQKRTEGEQGTTTLHEFMTDGVFTQAAPLKERMIEVVGDSYTCGYGAENSVKRDPFKAETECSAKSYAGIVARYFDADYVAVAHSGMGIARNYNSKFADWYMPDRYLQTFDMDSTQATRWDASKSAFKPAITIVWLGANDFSCSMQPSYESYAKHYYQLIREIRANYGEDHPILCCARKDLDILFMYVRRMVLDSDMKDIYYVGFFGGLFHDDDRNLGASYHPNYEAHRKVASVLIPYVGTITEWELQDRPIK